MSSPAPFALANYDVLSSLGNGNSAVVYTVRSRPTNSTEPETHSVISKVHHHCNAAKFIPHDKLTDAIRQEISIHCSLAHPNIIPLLRVTTATPTTLSTTVSSSKGGHKLALALILEHAPAGDLFTEVSSAGFLEAAIVRRRITHIANALQYLHLNSIVHLDVKLENVVLANDASAKLIDFGCARRLQQTRPSHTCIGGTLQYLPPELVSDPEMEPTTAMDAWSLGVLTYTALTGAYPFNYIPSTGEDAIDDQQVEQFVRQRILNESPHSPPSYICIPPDLERIITGLLQKDPTKRLTINEVLNILNESQRCSFMFRTSRYQRRPYLARRSRPVSPAAPAEADFTPACSSPDSSCPIGQKQTMRAALTVFDLVRDQRCTTTQEDFVSKNLSICLPTDISCQRLSAQCDASPSSVPTTPVTV